MFVEDEDEEKGEDLAIKSTPLCNNTSDNKGRTSGKSHNASTISKKELE